MGVKRQRGWIWKEVGGGELNIIKTQNTLNKILKESVKQTTTTKPISMGLARGLTLRQF